MNDVKLQQQDGEWPVLIAPPGATVTKAIIDGSSGNLHLALSYPTLRWHGDITIPAPWTFTSCLLALSSEQLDISEGGYQPASDLIGLEGAALSAIERDVDRIDLVFHSIRLSIFSRRGQN